MLTELCQDIDTFQKLGIALSPPTAACNTIMTLISGKLQTVLGSCTKFAPSEEEQAKHQAMNV